jgi:hypothetical protein
MIINKYGRVAGSIDLAQLADLYAQATDEDLKAHFRQVAAENGVNLDEPESEPESEPAEVKASMALSKDELVALAEAAQIGTREELEQFTKQELVDELKANEEG